MYALAVSVACNEDENSSNNREYYSDDKSYSSPYTTDNEYNYAGIERKDCILYASPAAFEREVDYLLEDE